MNEKINLITTGMTGMIGHTIRPYLEKHFNIIYERVDITNYKKVAKYIKKYDAPYILHLAALTDVDYCENNPKEALEINSAGTYYLTHAAKETGKKLIYISTDFVFDGQILNVAYGETEEPNPINAYGLTKLAGEENIWLEMDKKDYLIVRISYPYGSTHPEKQDFVQKTSTRMITYKKISGITDQKTAPTYIPDIAEAIIQLVHKEKSGVYHVAGSSWHTGYDLMKMIRDTFEYTDVAVNKVDMRQVYKKRGDWKTGSRPFNSVLSTIKIQEELGLKTKTFQEGLDIIKQEGKETVYTSS